MTVDVRRLALVVLHARLRIPFSILDHVSNLGLRYADVLGRHVVGEVHELLPRAGHFPAWLECKLAKLAGRAADRTDRLDCAVGYKGLNRLVKAQAAARLREKMHRRCPPT